MSEHVSTDRKPQLIGGRIKQRVKLGKGRYVWRTAAWCNTHQDLAWRYGDGGIECMHQLVVESDTRDCVVQTLNGKAILAKPRRVREEAT